MLASEARRAGSRFFSPIPKPSFQSFRKVTAETFLTNVLCKNDVVFLITSRPNQTSSVKSFLQNQNRFYISSFKANKCDRKLWSVNVLNYGYSRTRVGSGIQTADNLHNILYYTYMCILADEKSRDKQIDKFENVEEGTMYVTLGFFSLQQQVCVCQFSTFSGPNG